MRVSRKAAFWLIAIILLGGNSALWAESPEEEFDIAFGKDYQAAKTDSKEASRLALAQRIVDTMHEKDVKPEVAAYLNDKVFELVGNSEKGLAIKTKSLELTSAIFPEKRLTYLESAMELGKKQLAAARQPTEKLVVAEGMVVAAAGLADAYREAGQYDSVLKTCRMVLPIARQYCESDVFKFESKIAEAYRLKALRVTESQLVVKIKSDPSDAKTRSSLVMLCLKDLDDPVEAAKYLLAENHDELATNIRLAANGFAGMSPSTTLAMAQWYLTLAGQGKSEARLAMAKQSEAYYERFLTLNPDDDLAHAKVEAELDKVEALTVKLSQSSGEMCNLLALVDPKKNLLAGQVEQTPRGLMITGRMPGIATVPVAVDGGSYELTVRYTITDGRNGIVIGLPVGRSHVNVVVDTGSDARTCGLGVIDGKPYYENKTKVVRPSGSVGSIMTVKVSVVLTGRAAVEIKATLNGNPLFAWTGKPSTLSPTEGFKTSKPESFVLGCWDSQVLIRSAEIKVLSGKLRKLSSEHSEHSEH